MRYIWREAFQAATGMEMVGFDLVPVWTSCSRDLVRITMSSKGSSG